MAARSYVWPSAATTGSCMTSQVIGHRYSSRAHNGALADSSLAQASTAKGDLVEAVGTVCVVTGCVSLFSACASCNMASI
eukprot:scaffold910_cov396-Prasinococcus_capsulatus_cf.AAC.31